MTNLLDVKSRNRRSTPPTSVSSGRWLFRTSIRALLGLLTIGATACNNDTAGRGTPANPATEHSSSSAVGAQQPSMTGGFDRRFIDMMVPHHEAGIAMAKVAQERASHPELKKKASEMVPKQEQEVRDLKTSRRGWFGSDETPAMSAMPMLAEMGQSRTENMAEHVRMLKEASEFDRTFLDHMIPHHRQAIEAAKLAQNRAEHAELKAMSAKMVSEQESELRELETWRGQWFGGK